MTRTQFRSQTPSRTLLPSRKLLLAAAISALLGTAPLAARAQEEGPVPTQVLVNVQSKSGAVPSASDITAEVNGKPTPITSFNLVPASDVQIALLLDDGLRQSVGLQLKDLKDWIQGQRPGTQVFVGYMQNGRVVGQPNFSTDYAAVANQLRLPMGISGVNGSPYFSVQDFIRAWPGGAEPSIPGQRSTAPSRSGAHARFVLMITNGVDRYNGSVSPLNQDSPYVQSAADDAQRAGVSIYSIYYADRGMGGNRASFSGQSYLSQIAEATGGASLYQGTFNPVSLSPFLKQFDEAVASTYVMTVDAVAHKKDTVVRLKLSAREKGLKLHAPSAIHPGERESSAGQ